MALISFLTFSSKINSNSERQKAARCIRALRCELADRIYSTIGYKDTVRQQSRLLLSFLTIEQLAFRSKTAEAASAIWLVFPTSRTNLGRIDQIAKCSSLVSSTNIIPFASWAYWCQRGSNWPPTSRKVKFATFDGWAPTVSCDPKSAVSGSWNWHVLMFYVLFCSRISLSPEFDG